MKILTVNSPGQFEWRDVPLPGLGPDEVLMRVEAVTTCPRWDINIRHNSMFGKGKFSYPITDGHPGHEAAGTVAAVGANVRGLREGQRICAWRDMGHGRQGCYAQYVPLPADAVLAVPDHLAVTEVASMELGMCVGASFLRLKRYQAIRGRRFGIMGLGPAGLIAAQMARAEGATEIIGFDPSPQRREFARDLLDSSYAPEEAGAEFPARPATPRLDSTIDCVGAKASVQWAMDHTDEVVALFGVQKEPYNFGVQHYENLTLAGYPGHSLEAANYALKLVEGGQLNLALLTTHRLPLSRYNEGVDLLENQEAIKVCFSPWE
jgi:threonine dehydrogenase-like Zn-dependent dehydrogenase